ncbi:MAG: hypothetical protein AAGB26_13365 [Planctomycetota bacterium]
MTPEPPVHFGDAPGSLPGEVYSRFGAVFLVDSGDGVPDNGNGSAQFKRVSIHIGDAAGLGGAFETADAHAAVYWDDVDMQE